MASCKPVVPVDVSARSIGAYTELSSGQLNMDSDPKSEPHPKTEYGLLRDKKVAEVQKALEPILRARRDL